MSKAAELANLIGNINAGGGGVNRNVFVNGATNVSQRSVSSTGLGASAGYFTADRWKFQVANTAGRFTATQDSSVPTGKGFANSIKLACTTADTSIASGEQFIFQQKIEGQNAQGFAKGTSEAKPFALSFYVKGNASATYVAALFDEDNTRYVGKTFSVTTDWTRVEITFPADTTGALDDDNASSLELWIWLHAGSTYKGGTLPLTWAGYSNANAAEGADSFFDSTSRTFFITGLQLEVGQNATEFEHEPFAVTRHKCLRYFESNYEAGYYPADGVDYRNTASPFLGNCYHQTSGGRYIITYHKFEVEKRASPTTTMYRVTGLGGGSTANRWDWFNYSGGWDETDDATEAGEISSQHHGALARDSEANVNEALNIAGGWEADAEL
jgi:hypothetical protein